MASTLQQPTRLLLLDDNPGDADLILRALDGAGLQVQADLARNSEEFQQLAQGQSYGIVVGDYRLPDWTGLDALRWLRASGREIPFILVTGTLGDEVAVECIKEGATDYILKDKLERLPAAVQRALREERLRAEQQRAQQELLRSEERYRRLFEGNPQPMWVYDRETLRFLAVNQAAVRHYGYSRNEFLSMTLREVRPPEDVPTLEQSVRSPADSLHKAGIWRHRTKFGQTIWVEITESRLDFEGRPAGLVLANDVTDRKRMEHKVYLQAAALESAANAIAISDAGGNLQWVNSAFERLTGYSRDEVLGRHTRLLKSGRHDVAFYKNMWDTILAGRVWEGELINRRKDGSLYPEHQTITPVRDANGVISHFVAIKQDISQRKRAEEALRSSEAEYRSIIEGAPYGIYRVTADGEILMANPMLAQMLGYESPADMVGLNTATALYLSPEDREQSASRWREHAIVSPYEVTWKRRDGKRIAVRLAGRLLQQPGLGQRSYEVFVENVTEQRSLEEQLRRAQRMEAVGRLAGGVAHDFNNLLMIIGSCAELVAESTHDPRKTGKYAAQIRDAVNRAAALTRQLLAFSRQQVLEPTLLSLNVVVSELGKMLPRLLGEDIETVFSLDRRLGSVSADRSQLEQVLMNLAVNARDAMPDGGKLTIETSNVELDCGATQRHGMEVTPGHYVLLAVTDTGIGMDADTQTRIFEPFFTTKERGKGTGLGLATVYGIVKQSGGFIWVYSEVGRGTTFKIYLPLASAPTHAAKMAAAQVEPTSGGSETILLVEDETDLRQVTEEYLQSMGYTVLAAGNGAEALEKCRSYAGPIHALITDMVMPGMSGSELAKAASQIRADLKVVYMSGYTDRTVDLTALQPGAVFLQKPISLTTLGKRLRTCLEGGPHTR